MKKFKLTHRIFVGNVTPKTEYFSESDPPKWLSEGGCKGSTMDNRWFWNDHVLTLNLNETVDTDFRTITRIE